MRATLKLTLLLGMLGASSALADAEIFIVNGNTGNTGFNDPTPVAPVGGNPGTTRGQQALIVFQEAARIWGQTIDSDVLITIFATFEPLTCTPGVGAVLGSAGPLNIFATTDPTFPPEIPLSIFPRSERWYPVALVNRYAFQDVAPNDFFDLSTFDIRARFNSDLGRPGPCQTFADFYYGLDNQHGAQIDLLTVLLHEFAHGLGFTYFENRTTFEFLDGTPSIWADFLLDNSINKHWVEMTAAERQASSVNDQHLVWDGPLTTAQVPATLGGPPLLRITAPNSLARDILEVGTASFGPPLTEMGISGDLQVASSLACNGMTLDPFAGHIAIIDRGTCAFVEKVKNAQLAGASAVVIANNAAGVIGMSGSDPTIAIPSLMISQANGMLLKDAIGMGTTVSAVLRLDRSLGLAGADGQNRAKHYVPATFAPGSSVAHFDTTATPNLLMEPAINSDLTHGLDLTVPLFEDMGWFLTDQSVEQVAPPAAMPGRTLTFAIHVKNPGPSAAKQVTVEHALSANLAFMSSSGACTTAFPCAIGTVPPRSTRTILATYRVPSDFAANSISSTASIRSPNNYNAQNDSVTATVTVSGGADLGIAVVGPATGAAGTSVSFVVVVTNAGPADATGVSVTTTPPTGLTFVSNTGACATAFPCAVGTIPGGQSRTFTSSYSIPASAAPGTVANAVAVSATTPDPVSTNNAATASLQITNAPPSVAANLGIIASAPSMVPRGQSLAVVVTVLNAGPSPAAAVQVTSTPPAGLTFSGNSGDCSTAYPCALGTLAPGATKTFTSSYAVPSGAATGTVTFNASVTSSTTDPVVANNSTTASSQVVAASSEGTGGSGNPDNCTAFGGPPLPILGLLAVLLLRRQRLRGRERS